MKEIKGKRIIVLDVATYKHPLNFFGLKYIETISYRILSMSMRNFREKNKN